MADGDEGEEEDGKAGDGEMDDDWRESPWHRRFFFFPGSQL
jgi:hypothetical protein